MNLLKFFFKKKRVESEKEKIKSRLLSKISRINKDYRKKDSYEKFIKVVKEFLRNILKIKENVTYEEALRLIEKKRIKKQEKEEIKKILNWVIEIEYSNEKINPKKLKVLINNLKTIIKNLGS